MHFLLLVCLGTLGITATNAQFLRPPFNLLNRPPAEPLQQANIIPIPPTVISEPPINSLVPIPNVNEPVTTIITDCSPTVCKNLADTIQLMIVCNLLQNTKAKSEAALQLAGPILNEFMATPTFDCGCANPIPTLASNLITPNVISPNLITPNIVSPNLITPNVVSTNVINPNLISKLSSVIGANSLPISPRLVSTVGGISPNLPLGGQISNSGLLNSIMGILGNIQA